ncbi:hypothetical protein M011DRAFT_394289 [Sporormia fimetaria CBS 119925]|uniref:FAD-binding FR-type domain-containing protein n=1 Tax=Sporormia fimetaria CBS 119925 TaxID=1340428 RepID=A0A6A6VR89_9PLEO|nr:hypothetical protein M011DRAFT_394289 [Sporormia fimetaria CBS 119925]
MSQSNSGKASLSHEERTSTEPRHEGLHCVTIDKIVPVNDRIRNYTLRIPEPSGIPFVAGQWLDVHVPGIPQAGGFTITSAPRQALPRPEAQDEKEESTPSLELAIQQSPGNPPAAWLWQEDGQILGKELRVRVGGSFVYPPPRIDMQTIGRVVFIAGGVGINPLISMLSHICQDGRSGSKPAVTFLYSTKVPSAQFEAKDILFLPRIISQLSSRPRSSLSLFLTGTWDGSHLPHSEQCEEVLSAALAQEKMESKVTQNTRTLSAKSERLTNEDLVKAVGSETDRGSTLFYVCGPPDMTDNIVENLRGFDGVHADRVMCEKWW